MVDLSLSRVLPWLLAAGLGGALSACADAPLDSTGDGTPAAEATSPDDLDADEDGLEDETFIDKAACNGRYQLSSDATRAGDTCNVHYDGAGSRCQGGATQGAIELGDFVRAQFPDLVNLRADGRGIQIYNCRKVRGGSGLSVHATGRAVDIFIPTLRGGAADNSKGDVIANWLIENAQRIGVQMIIWDRTIWKASGSPRSRCYTGQHPHNDHVHVELSIPAGRMQTPFFTEGPTMDAGDQSSSPAPGAADGAPVSDGADAAEPAPLRPSDAWIGDVCTQNTDCAFSTDQGVGRCFLDHRPVSGRGFCTVDCAGYCPDRSGKAVTFCVSASLAGGAGGGVCVSKSGAENAACSNPSGFTAESADRYVGGSGARAAQAEVCLPLE